MGEHTEKCLYLRLKQGGDAHPERKDAGVLLSERERRKEPIKSFMWSSSSFLFPHLTYPGTLLWVAHAPLNQEGSLSEGFGEERDSLRSGLTPWLLTHKGPFSACLVSSLSQKRGRRSLNSLLRVLPLPLFVLAMIVSLRCLQEVETGYLPCFCCYIHLEANRRLTVNASTGAHLTLISGNANKRLIVNV